jgi:hypothetical protein
MTPHFLRPLLSLILSIVALYVGAQSPLFSSYDCRERSAEIVSVQPVNVSLDFSDLHQSIEAYADALFWILPDTVDGWKNWATNENYKFGKDRGDLMMISDLRALHPYFRDRIIELIRLCKARGIELAVVETYRTHAKQHEYKSMGRKFTRSGAGRSKHQYGLAVDVVPIVNGQAEWHDLALWKRIGVIGERLGLRWGGRWRHPFDPGHFEWTGGLGTADLMTGKFPPIPQQDAQYPCITEDLRLLSRYWDSWETEQSSLASKR